MSNSYPLCDHCGSTIMDFYSSSEDRVYWCSTCVINNKELLLKLGLITATGGPVNLDGALTISLPENKEKLRKVPKGNATSEWICKIKTCSRPNYMDKTSCWWCGSSK